MEKLYDRADILVCCDCTEARKECTLNINRRRADICKVNTATPAPRCNSEPEPLHKRGLGEGRGGAKSEA